MVAASAIFTLSILGPPFVLSLVRKPVDYFSLNPWLKRLPEYLANGDVPLTVKVAKLWTLALAWCSADSPMGGTDWGFTLDLADLVRIAATSALFGLYFALWRYARDRRTPAAGLGPGARGGLLGAVASVFGLSTGPCSVMGCGAPVLPVIGLAFAGLSSGTLKFLAQLSTIATTAVVLALVAGVSYLGWDLGRQSQVRPRA